MKRGKLIGIIAVFALGFSASPFFANCSLFSGPPDKDLLKKIDAEIAWANAKKLIVTVAFPQEWGTSPQRGENQCGDVRQGFAFNVEFVPSSAFSLIGWEQNDHHYSA